MKNYNVSLRWLIYTFIIGLSASACFSMLTVSLMPLSPFAFLTLIFSCDRFYALYIANDNHEESIRPAWATLFIGLFSYHAYTGALHPELGSNLFSVIMILILCIWLMYRLMFGNKHYEP
ncbi:hypothetical protein PCNPT3_12755 [Psychromonas sp. CNPT3]|uniref:DUF1422 family protein n=1 Tax=Psychromonas sp. CNPT3 TaxID=314282 RepID=UPI00006E5058|nr:DUF1422 family protein [Psychromonas sp. CNPT3]AGH82487.1 hypothetical protein PCNPT3_12755 [Psychromonas sp. CNPT3]